jgi:acetate---CoA ligase (ADP-forming) subunit beta
LPDTTVIIDTARREARTMLTEVESKSLLAEAGITVSDTHLATGAAEAAALAGRAGFPVVLKIVSPDIIHKSDVGGVCLNIHNEAEVSLAYERLMAAVGKAEPEARLPGVSVQKQVDGGVELLVGMFRDAQFGPVIAFALGGTLVEILDDVSLRLVPLRRRDAVQMIDEIKGKKLLEGFRGRPPVNKKALQDMLLAVSAFVEKNPDIAELDLNPVMADENGAVAVDARILLGENRA